MLMAMTIFWLERMGTTMWVPLCLLWTVSGTIDLSAGDMASGVLSGDTGVSGLKVILSDCCVIRH